MSVVRQAGWAFVGVGGQQIIRFVVVIFLARLLSPAEFGVVAAAQIIVAFAQNFVDFGLGIGLLRSERIDRATERGVMTVVIASSAVIAVALALSASVLASFVGIPDVKSILPWMAVAFFAQGSTGPLFQLMYRAGRYREVSMVQLLSNSLGYGAVSIVLAAIGWSYWAIVAALLVQSLCQFALSFALRPVWPALRPDWQRLRPILHFAVGVLTSNALNTVALKSDNWVAGKFLGPAALGFYSRAYSLLDLANQLPGVIMTRVMIPHFARHAQSFERRRLAVSQFYTAHVAAAAMTIPASIATILLAPEIITLLLGSQWLPVAPVLAVLGSGIFLRLAYKVSGTIVLAYGRSWRAALQQAGYAAMVLGGSLLGKRYGLEGIAFAVVVALAWQFWRQTGLALSSIGGEWQALAIALLPVILSGVAGAIGGSTAYLLLAAEANPWIRLLLIGGAVAAPYVSSLWLFRGTREIALLVRIGASAFGGKERSADK